MPRSTRLILRLSAAGAALALIVVAANSALASSGPGGGGGGGGGGDGGGGGAVAAKVNVINQVADIAGSGLITDPDVRNPWGLALGPTGGALWVANNNSNTATLYTGGVDGAAVTKSTLTVAVPGGKPTGQAFSGGTDFVVTGPGGSGPARFLFSSDTGDITAWNPTADRTNAIVVAHVDGAVYRGLSFLATSTGNFLLASDFRNNHIDVFDSTFHKVALAAGQFVDRNIPSGFTPFNVQAVGSSVYVAYAKPENGAAEPSGSGGFVDVFTNFGMNVSRIASNGTLKGPWGLAIAPPSFGTIAGDLLVGNFKDGFINVFQGTRFVGQLADRNNRIIQIPKLWALTPGNAANGGTNVVWFSAGPEDGQHGIVGELVPAA